MDKNYKLNYRSKKAFTLAEVLITLGIIGVVAAMTMPTLVTKYQKRVYVEKLKQSYSVLSNLTQRIMGEEGVTDFSETEFFNAFYSARLACEDESTCFEDFWKNYLSKYLSFNIYKCVGDKDKACESKQLNWASLDGYYPEGANMIAMNNGAFIRRFDVLKLDYSSIKHSKPNTDCLYALVDVNGAAPPNTRGRDQFIYWMACNGVWYAQYSELYARMRYGDDNWRTSTSYWRNNNMAGCNPNVITQGEGCAARIMEEGWEMNY